MPQAPYSKLMPKQKAVKKVTKPKAKKLIPLMEPELAGDVEAPVVEETPVVDSTAVDSTVAPAEAPAEAAPAK